MAKRVKALNERREELKAGIVKATARKRASLVRRNETTDKIKETLANMKVLQESQIKPSSSRSWPRPVSARRNWRSRSSSRA